MEAYSKEMQVCEIVLMVGTMVEIECELQLRSADEGSTVFYTVRVVYFDGCERMADYSTQCASCKHGWRVNN